MATYRHARHEGGVELPAEVGDVADGGVEDAGDEHELEDAEEADPAHVGGPHQVQVGVGVTAEITDQCHHALTPLSSIPQLDLPLLITKPPDLIPNIIRDGFLVKLCNLLQNLYGLEMER